MKVLNWNNQKCYSEVHNKSQSIPYHKQSTKCTHRTLYNNNAINSEADATRTRKQFR